MKHLKSFIHIKENNINYNVGDYVLINTSVDFSENFGLFPFAKIIYIDNNTYNITLYQIETIDLFGDDLTTSMTKIESIIRKLTPEEIEEYKKMITQNKFNL
jgi:hypothetical protein